MIITLNTETREITKTPTDSDKEMSRPQIEAEAGNALAATIACQAMEYFKKSEIRAKYVDAIATAAKSMIKRAEEKESEAGSE